MNVEPFEFVTLTQLGHLFGMSAQQMGSVLVRVGLRTPAKMPSKGAIDGGYIKQLPMGRDSLPFFVWHRARTVRCLEAAGCRLVDGGQAPEPAEPPPLGGPFTLRYDGGKDYALVGSNGAEVSVRGEDNAEKLAALMNLAHRCRKL